MAGKKSKKFYEVRDSGIHGRGLYASKHIPQDTWIIEYLGEKVSKEESDRRAVNLLAEAKESGGARVYMFILDDQWDLDGDKPDNDARLMNHSCDPNVEAQIWQDKEIWFIALRDIEKGEELTFNYGFDLEHFEDHPCQCGAGRCVGYIVDESYWPLLKRKIAGKRAWATRQLREAGGNGKTQVKSGKATSKRSSKVK